MNIDIEKPSFKQLVLLNMQQLTNFPYIEKDFDAITDYQLLCKVVEYLNDVIKNQNTTSEAVLGLYNAFITLKDYVDNYFTNLDVQDEIDNKLNEMAEDGTLQEIITDYLNARALFGFDNVASMKESTNLINGSYAKTLGFYEKNDGGSATYKIRNITNDDIVDNSTIIPLIDNNLIAELIISDEMSVNSFGCYGDNIHDDTEKFQIALNKCLNLRLLAEKNYKITSTLTIRSNTKLEGCGVSSKITSYIDNGTAIFYNNSNIMHFIIKDFYIDGSNLNCFGFQFTNPYDNCVFKNIYFDNFTKACLELGNSDTISQTLLIDNCVAYMSSSVSLDTPIFHLTKCYESNILNNKLLNRQSNYNDSPCLLLENIYDNNIQGNSFTCSHECGIKITGSDCRHNRILSNTYELIDGTASIKLIGTANDAILHTLIVEAFTYYSAPDAVYCENEANGFIVGMRCSGGRRNLILNVNDLNVQTPGGNVTVTADGGFLTTKGIGIAGYNDVKKYNIKTNDSANVDYGLEVIHTGLNKKFILNLTGHYFGSDLNGCRIMLKSPDGNTTKYIGINDNGEIQAYTYPS